MDPRIADIQEKIARLQRELVLLRKQSPQESLEDYEFQTANGAVKLSDLFGDRDELLLIHNMGRGCAWCTLWADALSSLQPYIESRCALAVMSPDAPEVQEDLARERNWRLQMVSDPGGSVSEALGFRESGAYLPGVSSLYRKGAAVFRHSRDFFGPGDAYMPVYHLFDLLHRGRDGWQPRYQLGAS